MARATDSTEVEGLRLQADSGIDTFVKGTEAVVAAARDLGKSAEAAAQQAAQFMTKANTTFDQGISLSYTADSLNIQTAGYKLSPTAENEASVQSISPPRSRPASLWLPADLPIRPPVSRASARRSPIVAGFEQVAAARDASVQHSAAAVAAIRTVSDQHAAAAGSLLLCPDGRDHRRHAAAGARGELWRRSWCRVRSLR